MASLQWDLNDMRAESRYLQTPGVRDTLQKPRQVTHTSTKVARFEATTSWEQYQQVFDAIVLSNGWHDATARLHDATALPFGGGHPECGPVGPCARRVSQVGLVDALTEHCGLPPTI